MVNLMSAQPPPILIVSCFLVMLGNPLILAQESEPASMPPPAAASASPWETLLEAMESRQWSQAQSAAEAVREASNSEPVQRATAVIVLRGIAFSQGNPKDLDPMTQEIISGLEASQAEALKRLNQAKAEESAARKAIESKKKERERVDKERGAELGLAFLDALTSSSRSGGTNAAQQARNVTQGKLDSIDKEIQREESSVGSALTKASQASAELSRIKGEIARAREEGAANRKLREGEFKAELLAFMGKLIEQDLLRPVSALAQLYPEDPGLSEAAQRAETLGKTRAKAQAMFAEKWGPVQENLDRKAYWTARTQIREIPASMGEEMKSEDFARVVNAELAMQQQRVETEIAQVEQKMETVATIARKDYRAGLAQLEDLGTAYADLPETQILDLKSRIRGWRLEQIEAEVKRQLEPIESAAQSDPRSALEASQAMEGSIPEDEKTEALPLIVAARDRITLLWASQVVEVRDRQWAAFEEFKARYGDRLESGSNPLLPIQSSFQTASEVVGKTDAALREVGKTYGELMAVAEMPETKAKLQEQSQALDAMRAEVAACQSRVEARKNAFDRDIMVGSGTLAFSVLTTGAFCWVRRKKSGEEI